MEAAAEGCVVVVSPARATMYTTMYTTMYIKYV